MLRTSCLILCLVAASQQLSITDFAVPSAVRIGENAELQCRHSAGPGEAMGSFYVKWWWTPLDEQSDKRQQIYQRMFNQKGQAQHKNITIKENDTIELLDLQPKDSGVFECEVSDDAKEQRQHQQLVVYTEGSGPMVNITRVEDGPDDGEEDDVVVICEASDVAPEPELLITINGQVIVDTELVNETGDGVYSIFANATLGKDVESGAEIRCELFFTNKNVSHEAYVATMTYDEEGVEASTTQAPEDTTFLDSSTDSNQNNTNGSAHLTKSWCLLISVAVPIQLLALH